MLEKQIKKDMKWFKIILLLLAIILGAYAFHKYSKTRKATRETTEQSEGAQGEIKSDAQNSDRNFKDTGAALGLRQAQRMTGSQLADIPQAKVVYRQGDAVAVADLETPEGVLLAAKQNYPVLSTL